MAFELNDGTVIPDRVWTYVRDYKEKEVNQAKFEATFGRTAIYQLNKTEFFIYFSKIVHKDNEYILNQPTKQ